MQPRLLSETITARLNVSLGKFGVTKHRVVAFYDRATEAWMMLIREEDPAPVGIALDYMQELTDDRPAAVRWIIDRAAYWLRDTIPDVEGEPNRVNRPGWCYRAGMVADALARHFFISTIEWVTQLHDDTIEWVTQLHDDTIEYERNSEHFENPADKRAARDWRSWCIGARRALELCREICDWAPDPPDTTIEERSQP